MKTIATMTTCEHSLTSCPALTLNSGHRRLPYLASLVSHSSYIRAQLVAVVPQPYNSLHTFALT